MICYKDMTFCPFYTTCWHGEHCHRALTPEVKVLADIWWEKPGAPISVHESEPGCFKEL
jgi:hypothetical protein